MHPQNLSVSGWITTGQWHSTYTHFFGDLFSVMTLKCKSFFKNGTCYTSYLQSKYPMRLLYKTSLHCFWFFCTVLLFWSCNWDIQLMYNDERLVLALHFIGLHWMRGDLVLYPALFYLHPVTEWLEFNMKNTRLFLNGWCG